MVPLGYNPNRDGGDSDPFDSAPECRLVKFELREPKTGSRRWFGKIKEIGVRPSGESYWFRNCEKPGRVLAVSKRSFPIKNWWRL